jgi:hypothetical protein
MTTPVIVWEDCGATQNQKEMLFSKNHAGGFCDRVFVLECCIRVSEWSSFYQTGAASKSS